MEEQQTRHAAEMRIGMHEIRETMAKHQIDDALIAADVHELKARIAQTSDAKRHVYTLLLSTGLVAAWEGTKHFMGWH